LLSALRQSIIQLWITTAHGSLYIAIKDSYAWFYTLVPYIIWNLSKSYFIAHSGIWFFTVSNDHTFTLYFFIQFASSALFCPVLAAVACRSLWCF
jgi:hypothetical protein